MIDPGPMGIEYRVYALILLWPLLASAGTVKVPDTQRPSQLWPSFDGAEDGRARVRLRLTMVAYGLDHPTDIQAVPGASAQFVVLEKGGEAWRIDLRARTAEPWFRITVETRSEQGLLGLAFHPQFAANGRFFVHANIRRGRRQLSQIREWLATPGSLARPVRSRVLLETLQPWPNHNGGQLAFGPDGMLYIGFGDGGAANDPMENGQNRNTLLGAMLRLDVNSQTRPYGIPPDNPFVGQAGARPEIWATGLRNPWRFSFTPDGRLIAGDVGQNRWEEITFVGRGDNLGWNRREGVECFPPASSCERGDARDPIYIYGRREGVSVTGGHVYTGRRIPQIAGSYVFGDFGSGRLWAITLPTQARTLKRSEATSLGRWTISPSAFGRGHDGELYVADFTGGGVYRLDPGGEAR